jgi:cytochrome c peroxidase
VPAPATDADFYPRNEPKEQLGRLLFFDKELSGNRNISCATCHHPLAATGDGLSLPVGEGAIGLGVTRDTGLGDDAVEERVPRNAPFVFNLGAVQFSTMFHDGRVQADPTQPGGFRSPAGADLPQGLDNALAVQAMFPVTSATEMAGQAAENDIAISAAAGLLAGPGGVWDLLAQRLQAIPDYVALFQAAYPGIATAEDITYVHAANAIAAFEAAAWRCDESRFDQYLRGDGSSLTKAERRGMNLFYGKADCSSCHSGTFQTDHQFHSIGMVQIGPGKGDEADGHGDFGREQVTGDPADRYRFRTPSLRMVAQTGPWGHAGAYDSLEAVIRHHLDPALAMAGYDPSQLVLPSREDLDAIDLVVQSDPFRREAIADSAEIDPLGLSDGEVADLIAFLHSLTDNACLDLRRDVPPAVPSGLTLAE